MSAQTLRMDPIAFGFPGSAYYEDALTVLADAPYDVLVDEHAALSGPDLVEAVQRATGALADAGVRQGSVVALLFAPNVASMVVARWAAHRLGATIVHLRSANPRTDEESLPVSVQSSVLEQVDADVLVVDEASAARGRALAAGRPGLRVVADLWGRRETRPQPGGRIDDTAVIDFTSGTTAAPRLVDQTYGSRTGLLQRLAAAQPAGPRRFVSVTPISHTTSPMIDATLSGAGTVVVLPGFTVTGMLEQIEAGMTETYLAVPHLYELVDDPRTARADLSRLRRIIYSGTPASPRRVSQAVELFGERLVQVYGTTETGGICALSGEDHREPSMLDAVGRPFPWVELRLLDIETGGPVPDGEAGEVCVRTPTGMRGYLADPDGTAATVDSSGWIHTGDIGSIDELGVVRLHGRLKGVVKTGGIKVYPETVEAVLCDHPRVREAVVLGVADSQRREHLHAVLSVRGDSQDLQDELARRVEAELGSACVPEGFVFWSGIPLTHSGKPNRAFVRSLIGGR